MDFVQVLNLKKQIFAKIPKQHLLVPSGANTATLYISVEDAAIQIVGYETEESNAQRRKRREFLGLIIVSYEGYKGKNEHTYLGGYHIARKQFQSFCSVPVSSIVGATFNNPFLST